MAITLNPKKAFTEDLPAAGLHLGIYAGITHEEPRKGQPYYLLKFKLPESGPDATFSERIYYEADRGKRMCNLARRLGLLAEEQMNEDEIQIDENASYGQRFCIEIKHEDFKRNDGQVEKQARLAYMGAYPEGYDKDAKVKEFWQGKQTLFGNVPPAGGGRKPQFDDADE